LAALANVPSPDKPFRQQSSGLMLFVPVRIAAMKMMNGFK
jgi:hypothetical protein